MGVPLRFLGYGVRNTDVPSGWAAIANAGITEVCSVSDCVNERPQGWVERWDYNRACCYDTEETATRTAHGQPGYSLLAYQLVLVKHADGAVVAVDPDAMFPKGLPDLPSGNVADGYVVLGYDVVSKQPELGSSIMDFGCSPLSCNALAGEMTVNPYCLFDDAETALRVAEKWDHEQPEPGPYYVVQVLRR